MKANAIAAGIIFLLSITHLPAGAPREWTNQSGEKSWPHWLKSRTRKLD